MKKDEKNLFLIDQLRKTNTNNFLLLIAVIFLSEILSIFPSILFGNFNQTLILFLMLVDIGVFLYVIIGNFVRWLKIKKMQEKMFK